MEPHDIVQSTIAHAVLLERGDGIFFTAEVIELQNVTANLHGGLRKDSGICSSSEDDIGVGVEGGDESRREPRRPWPIAQQNNPEKPPLQHRRRPLDVHSQGGLRDSWMSKWNTKVGDGRGRNPSEMPIKADLRSLHEC
uniref:Uncharacterized protein n=1 Tax=Sphaerodactylus townsendi TaxID=933632 RepID=A0ACB8E508_9SAUR